MGIENHRGRRVVAGCPHLSGDLRLRELRLLHRSLRLRPRLQNWNFPAFCGRGYGKQVNSDQGSQYTDQHLHELLAENGVTCSKSRVGNVWDDAAMDSFSSSLKTERIRGKVYRTLDEARADVFDYIERFYHAVRRHSTIGYVSPVEFERKVGLA